MKQIFVTGATGFLGNILTRQLLQEGNTVHALVRNPQSKFLPQHNCLKVFMGDLLQPVAIREAMKGCSEVYHVAADIRIWTSDIREIFDTNIRGANHIFQAALDSGVQKLVFTSSCGVMGPSVSAPMKEEDPRHISYNVAYELSKKIAEENALKFYEKGLPVVIVRPSRLYGRGPVTGAFSTMHMIRSMLKNKMVMIPAPGNYISNFGFADDVAQGHILAMSLGVPGEIYILGGEDITHFEFFDAVRQCMGGRGRIITVPRTVVEYWGHLQMAGYRLTGIKPMYAPNTVNRVFAHHLYSSEKAINHLNYTITPFAAAIEETVRYLKDNLT